MMRTGRSSGPPRDACTTWSLEAEAALIARIQTMDADALRAALTRFVRAACAVTRQSPTTSRAQWVVEAEYLAIDEPAGRMDDDGRPP